MAIDVSNSGPIGRPRHLGSVCDRALLAIEHKVIAMLKHPLADIDFCDRVRSTKSTDLNFIDGWCMCNGMLLWVQNSGDTA